MQCSNHIQNSIISICIAPHKCQKQRKLCVECLYNHGVDIAKQTVQIKIFQEMLAKKQKESKFSDTQELTQQRMDLQQVLSETGNIMKKIWEYLQESFKQIYDLIELSDKTYESIINNKTNPAELSNTHLEILVQILEGNKLNEWNAEKNFNLMKLQKVKNVLGQEIKAFNEKMKKKMKELLSEEFNKDAQIKMNKKVEMKAVKEAFINNIDLREDLSNKKKNCQTKIKFYYQYYQIFQNQFLYLVNKKTSVLRERQA